MKLPEWRWVLYKGANRSRFADRQVLRCEPDGSHEPPRPARPNEMAENRGEELSDGSSGAPAEVDSDPDPSRILSNWSSEADHIPRGYWTVYQPVLAQRPRELLPRCSKAPLSGYAGSR